VVILDFWTYGCINCIHVLADLKRLEARFGESLLVIGVHTPKFENEKNLETLRNIVIRYDIQHPVVNDVDSQLGAYYGMRAWPTRVLIDPAGEVLGRVTGEGRYALFEQTIAQLLDEHQVSIAPKPLPMDLEKDRMPESLLGAPSKIATAANRVAISDSLKHRIILTDSRGKIVQIYGGPRPGQQDGDAVTSGFRAPQGLLLSEQQIYVADTGNHLIRLIDIPSGRVTTLAGNGRLERHAAGQFTARQVGLASPWALALQGNHLYIAMAGSHQIWRLDIETGRIGPYAGTGREGIRDGAIGRATFSQPSGLSISGDWLYIADAEASAVRRIHLSEERVETLVGTGLFDFGDRDGPFARALLQHVLGILVYQPDQLFIADTYNHKLKAVDLKHKTVTSLVGTDGPGVYDQQQGLIQLNEPGGLSRLGDQILITDTNNQRIIRYDPQKRQAAVWRLSQD
jgi:thiol-disulfide isomerase/thioredoxin